MKYLFYRGCTEARWLYAGPYTDEQIANVISGSRQEILWLAKEMAGANEAIAYQTLLYTEDTARGNPGNLNNPDTWRYGSTPPGGPNYGISDLWINRPWVGTYYAGAAERNRQYWSQTFTNGGEALRFAAKKIAERGLDPNGYQSYPRVCTSPHLDWMARVPTVELVGDPTPENYATTKDFDIATLPAPTCGNCGFYGHRKDSCEAPPRAYDRVGIEVEGRWFDLPAMKAKALALTGGSGYADGSVYRDNLLQADPWEFQTKPETLRRALEQLLEIYPDSADEKCGMHVHVSFNPGDTGLLTTKDFFDYFKRRWTEWGKEMQINPASEFWTRLNGKNSFCKPNVVILGRDPTVMDRYAQLNFASWNEHKTVECRLLPMFRKSSLAVAAITHLLHIYEDYLNQGFEDKLPVEEVTLPKPETTPYREKHEFSVEDYLAKVKLTHVVELNDLPPVAKGMRRVAMPTGRTFPNIDKQDFGANLLKRAP